MEIYKPLLVIVLIILYGIFYNIGSNNFITGGSSDKKKTYVNQNKLDYYDDDYPGYDDGVNGTAYGAVETTVDAPLWKFAFELSKYYYDKIPDEDTELFFETMKM